MKVHTATRIKLNICIVCVIRRMSFRSIGFVTYRRDLAMEVQCDILHGAKSESTHLFPSMEILKFYLTYINIEEPTFLAKLKSVETPCIGLMRALNLLACGRESNS